MMIKVVNSIFSVIGCALFGGFVFGFIDLSDKNFDERLDTEVRILGQALVVLPDESGIPQASNTPSTFVPCGTTSIAADGVAPFFVECDGI